MKPENSTILTINGGSSSIKFALYKSKESLEQLFSGEMENIGSDNTRLSFTITNKKEVVNIAAADHLRAANILIDWLEKRAGFNTVTAIGHRIVHGMEHTAPEPITPELLEELKKISNYAPEHLPEEIKLIEVFQERYPALPQIACFDTSFHASMPPIAKLLPIPRRYAAMGIQRYGFHGLSYSFLMEELNRIDENETANGKVILAHLGSGASLAAIKEGKSVDTSMGFTPTGGLPMGTRTGELDPGVAWYLMEVEKLSIKKFNHLINHESGLLGISEISSDVRELINCEDADNRAAEAIEFFCYQTKKWVGSYIAVLGGLETLVFSGGIGEHSPEIRSKICDGFEFLGMELDEIKNMNNEGVISTDKSKITVRVIKTNEEWMIAKLVYEALNGVAKK